MVSFFNEKEPLLPALQYSGTQGFFHNYNVRLAARRLRQMWSKLNARHGRKKPG
jgi:hypothetical protein